MKERLLDMFTYVEVVLAQDLYDKVQHFLDDVCPNGKFHTKYLGF
jgi:hypothetical protein